jgi:hypothetical protein
VGNLLSTINQYNEVKMQIKTCRVNTLFYLRLAALRAEIEVLRKQPWDPTTYDNLLFNCKDDTFLEVLLSNIKGSVISFQTWKKKAAKPKKNHT